MRVYYAHPMSIYHTPQEERDIATLKAMGFEVLNPSEKLICDQCAAMRRAGRADEIMNVVFRPLILNNCNALAFRSFPDGSISAGVAKEIEYAKEAFLPIIELPSSILRRTLTIGETRETLAELGSR